MCLQELLDTVLQMMRGRPPPHFALHVYHHGCVLMMAWAWCEYQQTLQFGGLIFNTAVHVVMYLYFFLRVVHKASTQSDLLTQLVGSICSLWFLAVLHTPSPPQPDTKEYL